MKGTLPDAAATAAAVLGTLSVALGSWLLVPRERAGAKATLPALRVCLVDMSASAIWRRKERGLHLERATVAQAEQAERKGEDFCTILFGREVRREFGPAPAATFPRRFEDGQKPFRYSFLGEPETRLAQALEAARALALDPARASSTVAVIGDGTYSGADPRPLLRELRERGVALERVDLPPADVPELAFGPLSLPREVEPGAPIAVDAEIFYAPGAGVPPRPTVPVGIDRQFGSGFSSEQVEVPVPTGIVPDEDGYLRWRFRRDVGRAEPGLTVVRLRGWRSAGFSDADSQDSSEGIVRCTGRLVVGMVTSEHPLLPHQKPSNLFSFTSNAGLQIETLRLEELPSRLEALDALVTCDLPPDRLPGEVLASFVERGGGWLCLAGDGFLPGFVAQRSASPGGALELLPLAPPDEKPEPRDVVVLVDRSGSMAGEPFENVRRAVLSLVEAAPVRDAIELRFFGERLSEAIPLKSTDDPRDAARILREATDRFRAGEGPGGSTAIARSLEAFASERERNGREALVFLLTDGRDTVDPDARDRCAKVIPRLLATRARVVVLGAGDDPDRDLLSKLVAPGEELRMVGALHSAFWRIAEIFRRELSADRIREGADLRVLPAGALLDPAAPATLGSEILRAQSPDSLSSWPAIQRYARAKAAAGAEVLWTSEKGEPLLAVHRVGRGVTAACAFAPIREWGIEWAPRVDLWAPLLRALARGRRELSPSLRFEGDGLTMEDLPVDAPAELEARFFAADAKVGDPPAVVLGLSPPTQGADPRRVRSGTWPRGSGIATEDLRSSSDPRLELGIADSSCPRVEIRVSGGSDSKWPAIVLPFATPRAPEFVLPRPRLHADELFAGSPGDRVPTGPSLRAHPAASWVLFSGLLLLSLASLSGFFARRAR